MFVQCVAPRVRSFKAFKTVGLATRWLKLNGHKVINVKHAHGRIIVNHWVR